MTADIPARIIGRLKRALDVLGEVRDSLEQGRAADRMFHGQGRYEADALAYTARDADAAQRELLRFREQASAQGVDADAAIAMLGGMPDLTLSPQAQAWMQPNGDAPHV